MTEGSMEQAPVFTADQHVRLECLKLALEESKIDPRRRGGLPHRALEFEQLVVHGTVKQRATIIDA